MILEVCWDDNLLTLSFGLSQSHGHGSWLVCAVSLTIWRLGVHFTLRNVNPHNITHSPISWNPRERMFVVQISLLTVTFLSLIWRMLSLIQPPEKSTHTLALHHVPIHGVSPSQSYSSSSPPSYVTSWMSVHAYTTLPGKVKWSGPHQWRREENEFNFHSVTCYTNSIISLILVNTTKLRNITCTSVATGVTLQSLECTFCRWVCVCVDCIAAAWVWVYSSPQRLATATLHCIAYIACNILYVCRRICWWHFVQLPDLWPHRQTTAADLNTMGHTDRQRNRENTRRQY